MEAGICAVGCDFVKEVGVAGNVEVEVLLSLSVISNLWISTESRGKTTYVVVALAQDA